MLYTNENGLSRNNSTLQATSTSRNEVKLISTSNFLGREINVYGSVENPLFLAKEVAEWIEYYLTSVNKLVNLVDDDEKVRKNVPTLGGMQEVWMLTEDGLYEVLFQSRKPIAKQFKKGVKEILKSIRRTGEFSSNNRKDKQPTISDKMKVATWLIKTLNLDEHSKLAIAKSIAEPLGLPTPEYVEEEVMLPISKILSRNGISISPQKANKKLLELGLLEQVERYSKRKGRNEQKYIISEKGKKFGKMHQFKDASFPSPAWFVDKSDDLINLLTNTTTGGLAYGE